MEGERSLAGPGMPVRGNLRTSDREYAVSLLGNDVLCCLPSFPLINSSLDSGTKGLKTVSKAVQSNGNRLDQ